MNLTPRHRRHPFRLQRAALAALCLVAALQGAQAAALQLDIPAQPLERSLAQLARQAGLQLLMPPDLVRGLQAAALRGPLELDEALRQLLRTSGLQARVSGGTLLIERTPASPASAETQLPVVRVTAAAEVERIGTFSRRGAPSPVEPGVVAAAMIERYAATDLEDVLATQPEAVVGGGHAIAQKIYLRGIEDTLLAVTVDGATVAGQPFHHTGRVQIEPELLKRVDVLAGTGDATTGPGALGGALRFTTKDPSDLLRQGERAGALLKGGYYSNAEGGKAHASAFGRLGDTWSALAALTYQDQGEYEDGAGRRVASSGARQQLGFVKLVGQLTSDHTLRLSHEAASDEGERTQRPQWVTSSFNRAYPLQRDRATTTLGYHWQPGGVNADVQATVYRTASELEQNVIGRWGLYLGNIASAGLDLRNTQRWGRHRLTYGIDHRRDRAEAGYAANPSEQQESGTVTGLYAQAQLAATDALELSLGARVDRYRLTNVHGHAQSANGVSPNLSIRYAPMQGLTLLAGHARALRGPVVRDTFKLDSLAVNAPDLKPERAGTSELGFEASPGPWRLNGKVYQTTLRNAIADPLGRPVQFENVGRLRSQGVLLHAAYEGPILRAGVGIHHNKATLNGQRLNGYEHNGLGSSQGDTLSASLDARLSDQVEIGWLGRAVRAIDALQTSVGTVRKPGYGVHDVYASWRPQAVPGMTLSLTVKNLLDKDYLDHGSNEDFQHLPDYQGVAGSREPGRELRLSVSVRF